MSLGSGETARYARRRLRSVETMHLVEKVTNNERQVEGAAVDRLVIRGPSAPDGPTRARGARTQWRAAQMDGPAQLTRRANSVDELGASPVRLRS